jgi:hypothetical protein
VVLRLKKSWKSEEKNWKLYKSRKNQILCHEIEPNQSKDRAMHEGDNPSFWDEPDAHFDYLSLFSGTQAEKKVGNPKKKIVKTVQAPKKPNTVPRNWAKPTINYVTDDHNFLCVKLMQYKIENSSQ